jgi:hypothetical protein
MSSEGYEDIGNQHIDDDLNGAFEQFFAKDIELPIEKPIHTFKLFIIIR